jgi:hypothetical protein
VDRGKLFSEIRERKLFANPKRVVRLSAAQVTGVEQILDA